MTDLAGTFDAILGQPWLAIHQPDIDYETGKATFGSTRCIENSTLFGDGLPPPLPSQLHPPGADFPKVSVNAIRKLVNRSDAALAVLTPEDWAQLTQEPQSDGLRAKKQYS